MASQLTLAYSAAAGCIIKIRELSTDVCLAAQAQLNFTCVLKCRGVLMKIGQQM